eukprot:scaffold36844_cov58-Phaeocystis_antarctica.AAC.4
MPSPGAVVRLHRLYLPRSSPPVYLLSIVRVDDPSHFLHLLLGRLIVILFGPTVQRDFLVRTQAQPRRAYELLNAFPAVNLELFQLDRKHWRGSVTGQHTKRALKVRVVDFRASRKPVRVLIVVEAPPVLLLTLSLHPLHRWRPQRGREVLCELVGVIPCPLHEADTGAASRSIAELSSLLTAATKVVVLTHGAIPGLAKGCEILAPASRRKRGAAAEARTKHNRVTKARSRVGLHEIDDAVAGTAGCDSVRERFMHCCAARFPDFNEDGQHIVIRRCRLPQSRQILGPIRPTNLQLYGRSSRRRDLHRQSLQCRGQHDSQDTAALLCTTNAFSGPKFCK